MIRPALLLLLIAACEPMDVAFHGKDPLPSPPGADSGDSGPAPDTDTDTAVDSGDTDTSAPVEEVCPTDWPDRSLATRTCTTPPETDWTLVEKDRTGLTGSDFSVGRFHDDDGDGDIDDDDRPGLLMHAGFDGRYLLDADLDVVEVYEAGSRGDAQAVIGRLDPTREGVQFILNYWYAGPAEERLGWHDPARYHDIPAGASYANPNTPWLTDLEGDGQPELLLRENVRSGLDGSVLATLEGEESIASVSADLDLDGTEEILGRRSNGGVGAVGVWASDGTWQAACMERDDSDLLYASAMFAVGDLDGDPEGEFVVALAAAGVTEVMLCDSDGALLTSVELAARFPAIGDLDGDGAAEIVVAVEDGLVALEPDGSVGLEVSMGTGHRGQPPITLADLDGDGAHEIVVRTIDDVRILDGTGANLASFPLTNINTDGAPLVVDLDGDGLSEIVLPFYAIDTAAGIVSLTTPLGGFAAPAPQEIWSNYVGIHPGDRLADGTVPGPSRGVHWASPETNVWQGLASGLGNTFPDLTVQSVEVCVLDCEETATVAVYVGNAGERALDASVTVRITSVADDTLLAEVTLEGPHEPGVARAVVAEVPAHELDGDFEVSLTHASTFPECDTLANLSFISGPHCP